MSESPWESGPRSPRSFTEVESGIILWLVRTQPLSIINSEIHNDLCAAIHNLAGADAAQRSPPFGLTGRVVVAEHPDERLAVGGVREVVLADRILAGALRQLRTRGPVLA